MGRVPPAAHRYGPDPSQFGELWLPDGPSVGTVVIIHGGFWRAQDDLSLGRPLAADLASRGDTVWNLEYRRSFAGGGGAAAVAGGGSGGGFLRVPPGPV